MIGSSSLPILSAHLRGIRMPVSSSFILYMPVSRLTHYTVVEAARGILSLRLVAFAKILQTVYPELPVEAEGWAFIPFCTDKSLGLREKEVESYSCAIRTVHVTDNISIRTGHRLLLWNS